MGENHSWRIRVIWCLYCHRRDYGLREGLGLSLKFFIGLVKVNAVLLGTSHETVAESEDETVAEPQDDMCIVPLRVRWLHRLVLLRPTKNGGTICV